MLSLAELVQDAQIGPDEAVALVRPGGVLVGDTVALLARIAARPPDSSGVAVSTDFENSPETLADTAAILVPVPASPRPTTKRRSGERLYLLTPVRDEPDKPAKDTIRQLLEAGWYVFGDATPGRKKIKPGNRITFYESSVGVVAEAQVASLPERQPPDAPRLVQKPEDYPWSFRVARPRFFFDAPVVIDADMRSRLDAFKGRNPNRPWAWLVQGTGSLTEHDFALLTNQPAPGEK